MLKAKGTSQFDRLCSKMPENALTELLKHHMARPADRAFKKAGLHVEKLEHALQLLNVYLPRVVLVNNAEDLVDQASLFLQNAARASVEEPGVFSLEQNIQEELTGQMPNPELRSSSPNKEKHACLELTPSNTNYSHVFSTPSGAPVSVCGRWTSIFCRAAAADVGQIRGERHSCRGFLFGHHLAERFFDLIGVSGDVSPWVTAKIWAYLSTAAGAASVKATQTLKAGAGW